uniref:Pept_C1 domain-containing protein n=1 Tax=Angiostrongylus cantonensis TaxID=6313 RepID=A0A0K0D0X8_ANGCA
MTRFVVAALIVSLSWVSAVPDRNVLGKQEGDVITPETQVLTGAALVDYVNKHQQLFKAEERADIGALRRKVMKSKYVNRNEKPRLDKTEDDDSKIPDSFDARIKWSHCPSISYIRDQSQCGSCWAVSSAEAMSDRVCIASHGKKTVELSADDIMSCCSECGFGPTINHGLVWLNLRIHNCILKKFRCDGGWPVSAWQYFVETGVVTGGLYGTKDACRPYEIPPCGIHKNETFYSNCTQEIDTPDCKTTCQAGYPISYDDDKTYGKTAYSVSNSVHAIQKEIMTYGPVVAAFTVYDDFFHYKTGIYKHVSGAEAGGHAVRILGWGQQGGVPYWLVANSWNTDWGENGYFRILRGSDECGIEDGVVAGQV